MQRTSSAAFQLCVRGGHKGHRRLVQLIDGIAVVGKHSVFLAARVKPGLEVREHAIFHTFA